VIKPWFIEESGRNARRFPRAGIGGEYNGGVLEQRLPELRKDAFNRKWI
jgi:hypothetical protein